MRRTRLKQLRTAPCIVAFWASQWLSGKEPAGDMGSVPGSGRPPGKGNGHLLQNILAQEILWTEEPGGYSPWSCKRVRQDLMTEKQHSCITMLCQFLLDSKVNQLHKYKYSLFFGSPSHLGHHRALRRVSCAIQYVLMSYLFYIQYQQCIYVNPNLPIHLLFPLVAIPLFSMSIFLFLITQRRSYYHPTLQMRTLRLTSEK